MSPKQPTKNQAMARTHNWNKACIGSSRATIFRCLQFDKKFSKKQRNTLHCIEVLLDDLYENWDKETKWHRERS